jgi:hypothetical protein
LEDLNPGLSLALAPGGGIARWAILGVGMDVVEDWVGVGIDGDVDHDVADGADDGADDGAYDGTYDGADDGADDGTYDGAYDGADDGADDGTYDGTYDGADDDAGEDADDDIEAEDGIGKPGGDGGTGFLNPIFSVFSLAPFTFGFCPPPSFLPPFPW